MDKLRRTRKNKIGLILFVLLIVVDITLFILSKNEYFLFTYHSTGWLIPIIPLLCWVFIYIFLLQIMEWSSTSIHSPKNSETLIVKHRVAVHGESTYFYEFYQQFLQGILIKKLPEQNISIIVYDHSPLLNTKSAIGLDHPNWINEKSVRFESIEGSKLIRLD